MGLLDQQETAQLQDSATPDSGMLRQIEAKIEAAVPEKLREDYHWLVNSGMKIAFDKQAHSQIVQGLESAENPVETIAKGVVGLLVMIDQKSQGTVNRAVMVPGGMTLVLMGLDYADKIGVMKIQPADIDRATQSFINMVLPKLGLDEKRLGPIMDGAQQAMNDPETMQRISQINEAPQEAQNGTARRTGNGSRGWLWNGIGTDR